MMITLASTMRKKELMDVEPVELPRLFGMRPGKYIFISLIIAAILIVFLVFFLPGIVKGGRLVDFESQLSEVGVIVDGTYIGSTEGSACFISSGRHEVSYIKNGIEISSGTLEVDHPVFATLLRRPGMTVEVPLDDTSAVYAGVYSDTFKQLVAYSGLTSTPEGYNIPPLYTAYAGDVIALGIDDVSADFPTLALYAANSTLLDDLEAAMAAFDAAGVSYGHIDISRIRGLVEGSLPASDITINQPLPVHSYSDGWHRFEEAGFTIGRNGAQDIEGMATLPVEVTTEAFEIAHQPVSEYEWALFMEANPYWAKSNKDQLVQDGMVDEYYLAGVNPTTWAHSSTPVRNISYNAALAYCQWLSAETGESYRLPTEAEWQLAAACASGRPWSSSLAVNASDTSSPAMMMGGLWEFTSSAYVPLGRLCGETFDASQLPLADIIVKGGSYINNPDEVTADTVGVMRRDVTSDWAGFRLVREL